MAAVVYLVRDLLFTAKIREAADHLGVEVTRADDPQALHAAAKSARLVLIDLRLPEALRAIELLAQDPATANVHSVGFIDHERLDVMEAAKTTGAREVMAKGQFSSSLPALLRRAAG